MSALSNQDLKDILHVTRVALDCDHIDTMREEVLYQLEKIFRCDKCTFFLADSSFKKLDYSGVVNLGFEKEWMEKHIQHYHEMDPHVPGLLHNPPIVTTQQIVTFKDLIRSEYYNDFLKPQSIHFQMDMILRSGKRLLGVLAFLRPQSTEDFSSRDRAKAELIMPYLVEILGKNILLDQIKRRATLFESITMDLPYEGKIILDDSCDIIYMDENAKGMLSLLTGRKKLHTEGGVRFHEKIYQSCERLRKAASLKEYPGPYEEELVFDASGTAKQITVVVRLVEKRIDLPVFLIHLLPEKNILSMEKRMNDCGLTPREQEVVYLVCQGLKNTEIGEKLFISRYTVENHLKSIYQKLCVQNRAKLIHRIISLS